MAGVQSGVKICHGSGVYDGTDLEPVGVDYMSRFMPQHTNEKRMVDVMSQVGSEFSGLLCLA